MKLKLKRPIVFFDLETTGMSPTEDRIVELAAVRIERDGEVTRYQSLINPGRPIPGRATAVHHISDGMVADAPRFSEVGRAFLEFAAESTLVAHNAYFDLGFLQESLARTGLPLWKGKTLDSPEIRNLFTLESIKNSEWYAERLISRQQIEVNALQHRLHEISDSPAKRAHEDSELAAVKSELKYKKSLGYLKSLAGTLGADPFVC